MISPKRFSTCKRRNKVIEVTENCKNYGSSIILPKVNTEGKEDFERVLMKGLSSEVTVTGLGHVIETPGDIT